MRYRILGATGLQVSVIGFGASPLGNVFGNVSGPEARSAVLCAVERGINFFDVSPYYGATLAEERLGDALRSVRPGVTLATKCGRYGAEHFDFSARTVTREFENSLRRLHTDYVDLLQVHDVEFGDTEQIIGETIPALRQLQASGKVRYVGISSYWPGLLATIAARIPVDTVLNYCHSNLMMDDMDVELSQTARVHDIGLVNASPLHMGLLAGETVPSWHPAPQSVKDVAADVVELCHAFSVQPTTLALYACLEHPVAATTLVGMRTAAEVETNCNALAFQANQQLLEAVRGRIAPVFNTTWPCGRPENQDPHGSIGARR